MPWVCVEYYYKRVEELLQKNEERLYRQNKTLMELTVKGAWVNESPDEAVKEIVEAASFLFPQSGSVSGGMRIIFPG